MNESVSESHMRAMDANYLRHWRLVHDLDILLRTPYAVARRGFFLSETRLKRERLLEAHDQHARSSVSPGGHEDGSEAAEQPG